MTKSFERLNWGQMCRVFSCLVCLMAIGCGGSQQADLSGKVTYKGQPIKDGAMRLFPISETAGDGAGAIIENGTYKIDIDSGLFEGEYRVSITGWKDSKRMIPNPEAGPGEPKRIPDTIQYLPSSYNQQTQLLVTLEPGANEKDFLLEDK